MYCKKAILVNWGNIPSLEFEFGPVNLFSGGNGSGKTTAADALQSLMTASYENLFTYNPGQDETTQRGRGGKQVRTLASYVLGCDDGSYSRPRTTDGYIVGIFHPTKGENGERFTAIMGIRAALETVGKQRQARQRELTFIILPDQELAISEFIKDDKVVHVDQIGNALKNKFGKSNVEIYDKKGTYLNRLYGAMRGMRTSVSKREAQHAAKTFSNFMAYKPVKSINEFVAREILEPRDLSEDIKQVSELMKTIHSMEAETRQITNVIDNLHRTNDVAQSYIDHWLEWKVGDYRELVRQSWVKQRAYVDAKNAQQDNQREQQESQSRINNLGDKKQALHQQLVTLEAQRQGIPALKDKDQLEHDIHANKNRLVEHAKPLLLQDKQFNANHQAATTLQKQLRESGLSVDVPELEQKAFNSALKQLLDVGANTGIEMQTLLTQDMVGIANLESKLDSLIEFEKAHQALVTRLHHRSSNDDASDNSASKAVSNLRDKVMSIANQRKASQSRLHEQLTQKKREVQTLQNQSTNYPPHVDAAIKAINHKCPQARPAVLCDFINITDPQWQMAIEGYIGGTRFAILVEPDFEAEAIRIVRNLPGRRNGSKIIQGSKAQRDAARLSTPKDSILDVMNFEHKIAEYYIKASYGNVLRVQDEHELKQTARGITPDGMGSGGYSLFRCDIDEADLVFGQGARERALKAKEHEVMALQTNHFQAEQSARQIAHIAELIDTIKSVNISDIVRTMLSLFRTIESDEQRLAALDLSDFKALEEELNTLKQEHDSSEQQLKELQTTLGKLESEQNALQKRAQELSKQQDTLQEQQEEAEAAIDGISELYPSFDAQAAISDAEIRATQHAKNADHDDSFDSENLAHEQHCYRDERELHECVMQHNQHCRQHDSIVYLVDTGSDGSAPHNREWFKRVVVVLNEAQSITNRLKNNVLVGKHERLSDLKDSFNTAFVTNLCHSIYQSINDGKRILDELNKELETHRFGTDQERYYFGMKWVPEFQEYQRFFSDVIALPSLGDGNSLFDADLSDKSAQVRDKLLSMLLDNDEQIALRELKRLSDYRHYREYEIYKEPKGKDPIALSQYGTGSGGQLETPAYIIRSAAVTSAFKFSEGSSHCRMVLVDEAFSKMDEARSREVINYLTQELGLQLIFIMPTSKSGPFMDLISHQTIFSKCPTSTKNGELNTQVLVDRKICNQDKIKELWAQHRRNIQVQTSLDFMEEFVGG